MGCGSSKQKLCKNCKAPYPPPLLRSYSLIHPPPAPKKEAYHAVALTIKLDSLDDKHHEIAKEGLIKKKEEIAIGIIDEARTCFSKLMDEKVTKIVPKTPTKTPTGKPEIIDAWELMEGLEGNSPISVIKSPFHNYTRSFSFHFSSYQSFDDDLTPTIDKTQPPLDGKDQSIVNTVDESDGNKLPVPEKEKEKLIVYFTSLRGVRKTYDDCCDVRRILKQLDVKIDERDVSMHSGFKTELKDLLDNGCNTNDEVMSTIVLPKLFIGRRCIGGAEEIRHMHEEGELRKAVEGVALAEDGGGVCEVCGDVRFVPCATCFGSCKVYYEEGGFRRCHDCNENGLVRCPICCCHS